MIALARRANGWMSSRPYLLLTLTCLMWGGNAVASRLAVGEISPFMLTGLRWVLVCSLMPLFVGRDLMRHRTVLLQHWKLIALMGCIGFTAFNTLMYVAAHLTTAINIGIVQGSIPIMVILGALLIYGTRASAIQWIGVAVTIAGVIFVAARGDVNALATLSFNNGDILMVIGCIFYSGYTVLLRERPISVPALVFFTAVAFFACLMSIPFIAWELATGTAALPTWTGFLIVAYVAFFPSLLGQLFFMRGVELIGAARAGVFVNLVPIFAPLLAVIILSEPFRWYHAAGLVLVLGGIAFAEAGKRDI